MFSTSARHAVGSPSSAAAIELPDNVRIPPSSQLQMLNRINKVLNTAQLGVAGAYGEEAQNRAAR